MTIKQLEEKLDSINFGIEECKAGHYENNKLILGVLYRKKTIYKGMLNNEVIMQGNFDDDTNLSRYSRKTVY